MPILQEKTDLLMEPHQHHKNLTIDTSNRQKNVTDGNCVSAKSATLPTMIFSGMHTKEKPSNFMSV